MTEAVECRVVSRFTVPPPFFERTEFWALEPAAIHSQRRKNSGGTPVSVLERVNGCECDMDPRAFERWMCVPVVHSLTQRGR